jgi:hypothetical protein
MTFDLNQYSHGRKAGVKLTVTILKSKLEELRSRFLENSDEENSDANDQIKMLQEIENAVKTKEALTQAGEELAKDEAVKKAEERKKEEQEESFEMLIEEDKVKKFQDFCSNNGIKIEPKTHAQEMVEQILREGRGGNHDHGADARGK